MPSTGSHIKVTKLGDNVHGVELRGDRALPEHDEFRLLFPGGDVIEVKDASKQLALVLEARNQGVDSRHHGDGVSLCRGFFFGNRSVFGLERANRFYRVLERQPILVALCPAGFFIARWCIGGCRCPGDEVSP